MAGCRQGASVVNAAWRSIPPRPEPTAQPWPSLYAAADGFRHLAPWTTWWPQATQHNSGEDPCELGLVHEEPLER